MPDNAKTTANSAAVLPDELVYLITAFHGSDEAATSNRSKAYLVLSSFCQGVRSTATSTAAGQTDPATEKITQALASHVLERISSPDESDILIGLSFLTALYQVDWQSASYILLENDVLGSINDFIDLGPSSQLSLGIAHLLGQASGHKNSRLAIPTDIVEWLKIKSNQTKDVPLRAASAIALVKLSRGSAVDGKEVADTSTATTDDDYLAKVMADIVIEDSGRPASIDAIEGLAYMTVEPSIKQYLADDPSFLSHLFSLAPRRRDSESHRADSTMVYGIFVIISNICAYRPQMSEEDAQIDRLKRMAKSDGTIDERKDILDDDERVISRCKKLIEAGVLEVLASGPGLESPAARLQASKAYLSLVEDKTNRGIILQSGGSRALTRLIRQSMTPPSGSQTQPQLEVSDLMAIQALAKLAITSSPVQVFGPEDGTMLDAVRPFATLVLHPSATLLQQFETMMALINLSSHSPAVATKIGAFNGLMNKVELNLLETNHLVRRAAMELICNLIAGSDAIYDAYGGSDESKGAKNHIHILLAMCDVDDLATRMAASGALATLTTAPSACRALWDLHREKRRVLVILAQLIDPSIGLEDEVDEEETEHPRKLQPYPGLVHRGVVCLRNFLLAGAQEPELRAMATEAIALGVSKALVQLIKTGDDPAVIKPATEALKFLLDQQK